MINTIPPFRKRIEVFYCPLCSYITNIGLELREHIKKKHKEFYELEKEFYH